MPNHTQNQAKKRPPLDFDEIRRQATGYYTSRIFSAVGIELRTPFGNHQPCPMCGGKDRFRCDDKKGEGTWICNQCGAGDGISLVHQYTGNHDIYDTFALVASVLGIDTTIKISDADRKAWKARQIEIEKQSEQDKLERQREVAKIAQQRWQSATPLTAHDYLNKKGLSHNLITNQLKQDKYGNILLPLYLHNTNTGNITLCNLQSISTDKKLFIKGGLVGGAFSTLGVIAPMGGVIFIAEGLATAGSIFLSLNGEYPVIVAFDAGNMVKCASTIRTLYPNHRLIFCADDDRATASKTGKNTGVESAQKAAKIAMGEMIVVDFGDDDRVNTGELTDFNDLHCAFGLASVTAQLTHAINHARPAVPTAQNTEITRLVSDFAMIVDDINGKMTNRVIDLGNDALTEYSLSAFIRAFGKELVKEWQEYPNKRQIDRTEIDRQRNDKAKTEYSYIYDNYVYITGTKEVYNKADNDRQSVDSLRIEYPNQYDQWLKSEGRLKVKKSNIWFDPKGERTANELYINTFKGLPLEAFGDDVSDEAVNTMCYPIIQLLDNLCGNDATVTEWVLNWLAIPLQNLGTKMDTALIFHGHVQGAGKSIFFDKILSRIYGSYHLTLGQGQLDTQYNDWIGGKLFALFEEILQNDKSYKNAGMLKHLVTGHTVFINKKFTAGWKEDNFVNSVFLSNEMMPLKIDSTDRRHLVVYPPREIDENIRLTVDKMLDEKDSPAVRAFYTHLLRRDVGKQNAHTHPPITQAKQDLIELSMASWERFYRDWKNGHIPDVPYQTATSADLYLAYRAYCFFAGEKTPTSQTRFATFIGKREHKERINLVRRIFKDSSWRESVGYHQTFIVNPPEWVPNDPKKSRQNVLSEEVDRFRESVKKYAPQHITAGYF